MTELRVSLPCRSIHRSGHSGAEALQPHRKENMFQSEDHSPQALLRATKQRPPGDRWIHHSRRYARCFVFCADGGRRCRGKVEGTSRVIDVSKGQNEFVVLCFTSVRCLHANCSDYQLGLGFILFFWCGGGAGVCYYIIY